MTEENLTVLEFAVKHHAEGCPTPVAQHVDSLISTTIAHHRVLWEVVVDDDGRASLIWASYPVDVWEGLMETAARMSAVESLLGALFGGDR